MSAAAAIVAVTEEYFKSYIVACEYLQIDPRAIHEQEFIQARANAFLEAFSDTDEKTLNKLKKKINWFAKHYKHLTGRWYEFSKRCQKLEKKDHLRIAPESISEQFEKRELTENNYVHYAAIAKKHGLIALAITGGIFVIAGIILLIVFI